MKLMQTMKNKYIAVSIKRTVSYLRTARVRPDEQPLFSLARNPAYLFNGKVGPTVTGFVPFAYNG